jgi:hypothetical protein
MTDTHTPSTKIIHEFRQASKSRKATRQRVSMQVAGFGSSDSNPIKKPDSCQSIAREGAHPQIDSIDVQPACTSRCSTASFNN